MIQTKHVIQIVRLSAFTVQLLQNALQYGMQLDEVVKHQMLCHILQTKQYFVPCQHVGILSTMLSSGLLELCDKLNDKCNALGVPKFNKQEIESLQEYVMVMKPVAATLDTLQGDNVYYGHVFPHLHSLQVKLEAFQNCQLKYAKLFAATMLAQMKTPFEKKLRFDVSHSCRIVAAVSHPLFKLQWVPTNKRAICREIFENAILASSEPLTATNLNVTTDSITENFVYNDDTPSAGATNGAYQECMLYLNDKDTSLNALNEYKTVRSLFVKFNTTVPLSASVERLFSTAGQIQTPRRNCLSDMMFEKLLLLKTNVFD